VIRPTTDDYPEQLQQAMEILLSEGTEAARKVLAPIAYARHEVPLRSDPSETVVASIYRRDHFHCRYCGCRVIPIPVMRLIAHQFPEEIPYHPNWKGGETHPAFASRSATLDHVIPWAAGGRNDPGNLACACWICNRVKGEFSLEQLGWQLLPISDDDGWDGLTRFYPELWRMAGEPRSSEHPLWVRLYS
jgi:hypothetical protein